MKATDPSLAGCSSAAGLLHLLTRPMLDKHPPLEVLSLVLGMSLVEVDNPPVKGSALLTVLFVGLFARRVF